MEFALWCNAHQPWPDLLEEARHAAATGWDGVWIADHFMGGEGQAPHECLALLAALAATVERVRLGSLVLGNTYRHPAVVANAAVTIDHVSSGRLVLGIGAGWQELEHTAYGISLARRLDRLEESCEVIRRLLDGEVVDFDGRHVHLTAASVGPRPVQPHVPLLIGGGGERRTLAIVARWADEWNTWGRPDVLARKGAVLDGWCEKIGRDPATIRRTAQVSLFMSEDESWLARRRETQMMRPTVVGTPDEVCDVVAAYRDAGVSEVIVPDMTLGSGTRRTETIDMFRERVASQFR